MPNPPKDLAELTEIRARAVAKAEGLHEPFIESLFLAEHSGSNISSDGMWCNESPYCDSCAANYYRNIVHAIAKADEAAGVVSVPHQSLGGYLYNGNGRKVFRITIETPYRPKPTEVEDER